MRRAARLLLLLAPLLVLALGVSLGVSLAGRAAVAPQLGEEAAGSLVVAVMATPTHAPPLGPRAPTRAPRVGPPAPTNAPALGPRAPTRASRTGPPAPTATPLPTVTAQNGLSGTITAIAGERLTVYTKARRVATVAVEPHTTIRLGGKNARLVALAVGDAVTVLGSRDEEGVFRAELIRAVRPDPPPTSDR